MFLKDCAEAEYYGPWLYVLPIVLYFYIAIIIYVLCMNACMSVSIVYVYERVCMCMEFPVRVQMGMCACMFYKHLCVIVYAIHDPGSSTV